MWDKLWGIWSALNANQIMREISNEAKLAKSWIFAKLQKVDTPNITAPIPPLLPHKLFELINISSVCILIFLSQFNFGRNSLQKWAIQSKWFGWGLCIAFHWLQSRFCPVHRWQNANMVHHIKDGYLSPQVPFLCQLISEVKNVD